MHISNLFFMGIAAIKKFLEFDYMEYATDTLAQAAYVSNDAEVVDQQQTTRTSIGQILGDSGGVEYRQAQGFQLSAQKTVSAVEVYIQGVVGSPAGNVTLRIETDNSGKPSGSLVDANASVAVAVGGVGVLKGSFATPFSLNGSTTYWLVIQCDNQSTGNRWTIDGTNSNPYANGEASQWDSSSGNWSLPFAGCDLYFKIYVVGSLQCYSESTIKTQGSYSLKGVSTTAALNKTLTHTISTTDLSGVGKIVYDIRASVTGSNIALDFCDTGGTTTLHIPNILVVDTFQRETVDLTSVADADKDAIYKFTVTITQATTAITFYLDNIRYK